ASRSCAWLGEILTIPEPVHPRHLPSGHGPVPGRDLVPVDVRFEGVHFSYLDGSEVLSGVDLEIPPGQIVAVCGPTGAGKTSLLNLLPRFYDPTAGRVALGG